VGLRNLPVLAPEYGHLGVGGAELQQTLLARALARKGYRVTMVVADYGQSDGATWSGVQTYKAFQPEAGLPVLRFLHPRWTGLWSALGRANADIYYTSCAGALVGQVAMYTKLHHRKLVFRIASNSDCDPNSLLVRFWRDKRLYRYGLRRADVILSQTPEQHAALLQNFSLDSRVLPSLTAEPGERRSFRDRDIDVLWVGNIRALKRPDVLLRLARELPERRFEMIGGPMPGSEALYESVQAEAASIPNVKFHGSVPYHAVGDFYSRARILVGTSEIEGFPNTYLQAWNHGSPVVAFLDPQQLLSWHALGRSVQTFEEMKAAVASLCADLAAWEPVSRRCLDYMESRCSETKTLVPYMDALASLRVSSARSAMGARRFNGAA
jgi:glycosyltransferase involved in cell wall biosynthesis